MAKVQCPKYKHTFSGSSPLKSATKAATLLAAGGTVATISVASAVPAAAAAATGYGIYKVWEWCSS